MQFRVKLFGALTLLTLILVLGWSCYAFGVTGKVVADATLTPSSGTSSNAYAAGAAIGGTTSALLCACPGGILALIFALLAWRNQAGLTAERRHQEQMEALRGQQ